MTLAYTTTWTVAVWAKIDSLAGSVNDPIWMFSDGTYYVALFANETSDKWYLNIEGVVTDQTLDITAGEWNHVAVVGWRVDSTEYATLYVDAVASANSSAVLHDVNPTSVYLGRNTAGTLYCDGKIAEFAVWADDLTSGNITSLQTLKPTSVGSPSVYLPLYDDGTEDILGLTVTNNGVAFNTGDHPPVSSGAGAVAPTMFNQRIRRR